MIKGNKNVRLVLVHPPLKNKVSAATPNYVDENRGYTPPMGLLYIQAAVEQTKHEVTFIDANLEGWDHKETARNVLILNPDLVGLQAMTFTMPDAYILATEIKNLNPNVKIIIGGPHPTIFPKETANLEAVDFAFSGEGEIAFPAFLDVFFEPGKWSEIPGLAFKKNRNILYTPDSGLIKDLDLIAYPARASSKYKKYSSVLAKRNPITIMITSRGCPFNCIFCNRMGRKYRAHSAQYVLGEIESIINLGIKEIFIHDDTFTLNRKRIIEICEGIIKRKYNIIWKARTRVDCVDEELLSLMRNAGCQRLSFGVESGSEKVLKSMRKEISLDRVENVFKWCKKEGIITIADFMFGNIDENMDDIQNTFKLMKRINPDYVQYSICSPYPGTPLYQLGLQNGIIPNDIWLEFAKDPKKEFCSLVWTQNFTKEELESITSAAYKAFYLRPLFIFKQIIKIKSFQQFWIMLRSAFYLIIKNRQ